MPHAACVFRPGLDDVDVGAGDAPAAAFRVHAAEHLLWGLATGVRQNVMILVDADLGGGAFRGAR